jgi:hypothetical protein
MRRLLSAAAAVAMLVALHPSSAAALIVLPHNQLFFSVPLTGTPDPYTLNLTARDVGSGANDYLDVWVSRTATAGKKPQQIDYFDVTGATMTCTSNLGSCDVNSGTQMGSLGQIHLFFSATGSSSMIQHTCPTDTGKAYTETRQSGHVTGTFVLKTGTSYFKTIRNAASAPVHIPSSITTRASKFTYGTDCSSSGPCTSDVFLGVSTPDGAISANQFTGTGKASIEFDVYDPEVASTAVRHQIFDQATMTVLHVTSNSPHPLQKISVSLPLQPFLSGSGTFTGSGNATVSTYTGCRETDRSGSFTGNFTAHLDGYGTKTFNGTNSSSSQRFVARP